MKLLLAQGGVTFLFICLIAQTKQNKLNFNDSYSDDAPHPSSVISDEVEHHTLANQDCQSRDIFYLFSDSLTCLCAAIFIAVLVRSPVSGLLEFQPPEVSLKQA